MSTSRVEDALREFKRQRLVEIFNRDDALWKDADHPELEAGAADWVRKLRAESESRFERILQQRDRE